MARSRVVNLANFQQFTAINLLSDPGHIGGPKVIPSCVEVTLQWGLTDGTFGHNVMHAAYGGGFVPTVTIANGLMSALTTGSAWTALASFMPVSGFLASVLLRDLNTAANPIVSATLAGVAGTSPSSAIPDETALVITLRTAKAGRGFRGRIYVPNWATNALGAAGVAASGAVTDLNAWAQTIPGAFSGQGLTLSLGQVARQAYIGSTGTSHPARTATTVPITSLVVRDNHWDSQRRRGLD
jgi:hypothetical protein